MLTPPIIVHAADRRAIGDVEAALNVLEIF
jgi:hypothetical protein